MNAEAKTTFMHIKLKGVRITVCVWQKIFTRDKVLPLSLHGQNTLIEKFILLNFCTIK